MTTNRKEQIKMKSVNTVSEAIDFNQSLSINQREYLDKAIDIQNILDSQRETLTTIQSG